MINRKNAIVFIKVEPIGRRLAFGFVDYAVGSGGLSSWDVPVYPRSQLGELLVVWKKNNKFTLRQAANILGVNPSDLSGLIEGSLTIDLPACKKILEIAFANMPPLLLSGDV